jgi:hypothetical protein
MEHMISLASKAFIEAICLHLPNMKGGKQELHAKGLAVKLRIGMRVMTMITMMSYHG